MSIRFFFHQRRLHRKVCSRFSTYWREGPASFQFLKWKHGNYGAWGHRVTAFPVGMRPTRWYTRCTWAHKFQCWVRIPTISYKWNRKDLVHICENVSGAKCSCNNSKYQYIIWGTECALDSFLLIRFKNSLKSVKSSSLTCVGSQFRIN